MKSFACLVLVVAVAATYGQSPAQKAFDRMKALEGTWEGFAGPKGNQTKGKVLYHLTAGGSALVETLMPGQPHEMVTVFHLDGQDLLMTHYCAAKNQPRMKLSPLKEPDTLAFNFVSGTNMKPMDSHMHAMKMKWIDKDHIVSEWMHYEKGKPAGSIVIDLKRVKG